MQTSETMYEGEADQSTSNRADSDEPRQPMREVWRVGFRTGRLRHGEPTPYHRYAHAPMMT